MRHFKIPGFRLFERWRWVLARGHETARPPEAEPSHDRSKESKQAIRVKSRITAGPAEA